MGRPTRALLSLLAAVTAVATTAPTPAAAADNLACKLTVAGTFYQYGHCTTLHHDPNVPITLLWKTNATHFWAGMTSPTAGWAAFAVSDDNLYGESPPPVTAVVGWAGAEAGAAAGGGVYTFPPTAPAGTMPMNASETAAAGYTYIVAERAADGTLLVAFERDRRVAPMVGDGALNILWAIGGSVGAGGKLSDAIGYVASGHTFAVAEGEFLEGA